MNRVSEVQIYDCIVLIQENQSNSGVNYSRVMLPWQSMFIEGG
jgi:hypothetical protein